MLKFENGNGNWKVEIGSDRIPFEAEIQFQISMFCYLN